MGQMASALAHEVTQPLSAIANYVAGARRLMERDDTSKVVQALDRASEQVERAGQVIRRLREFVKKEKGDQREESLAQTIEEASVLALVGSKVKGVKAELRLDAQAPTAVINKVQIQQVLVNLVRNAVEAMTDAPRRELVIATARSSEGMIEVAVSDTGPGIADAIKPGLFQPFVTSKDTGMGVGLSICRTIVETHGGELWAEDNPGGGATLRFTVPGSPLAATQAGAG